METRSTRRGRERTITDPATYLQKHDFKNEKIIHVQEDRVTDMKDWFRYTCPDKHDLHTESYTMRFRYTFAKQSNNFLMVTDNGQVSASGDDKDERTFFTVIHDHMNDVYQFICNGGRCKDHIFFMDGCHLQTRVHTILDMKPSHNQDTLFMLKGLAQDKMFEIISKKGNYQLKFDLETGQYLTPNSKRANRSLPSSKFATFVTRTIRVSSV